jgi:hypothetical protein
MKKTLQILSLIVVLTAVITWSVTGANRGWTKTSVPVKTLDEVTGIEGITYQKKFLPGVDFLAAAIGAAGSLAGASVFFRRPTASQSNQTINQ